MIDNIELLTMMADIMYQNILSKLYSLFTLEKNHTYLQILKKLIKEHRVVRTLTLCSSAVVLYAIWFLRRPKNLPPGPYGYPIVGSSLPFLKNAERTPIMDLAAKYGDVFCLWMGGNRYVIILNSYEAIKEAYLTKGTAFMDRHAEEMIEVSQVEDTIIAAHYNELYKDSRKTGTQAIRTLISSELEHLLEEELNQVETYIEMNQGEVVDLSFSIQRVLTNTTTRLLFNKRYNDKESENLTGKLQNWLKDFSQPFGVSIFPRYMAKLTILSMNPRAREELVSMIEVHLNKHKASVKDGKIQDVMDAYLKNNTSAGKYTDEKIVGTLLFLLPDAILTTSVMTMWVLLYLTNHSDCQEGIYEEIIEVAGTEIGLTKRPKMPITESFIMEVLRHVNAFPFGIPSKPMKSTVFRGFSIPETATILPHYGAVHVDARLFPEPEIFKPKRFIKDGQIGNAEGFMPFGIGRRTCMGASLFRNEVFYIVTRLLTKYKIYSPDGAPLSTDHVMNVLKCPTEYSLRFEKRQ